MDEKRQIRRHDGEGLSVMGEFLMLGWGGQMEKWLREAHQWADRVKSEGRKSMAKGA